MALYRGAVYRGLYFCVGRMQFLHRGVCLIPQVQKTPVVQYNHKESTAATKDDEKQATTITISRRFGTHKEAVQMAGFGIR